MARLEHQEALGDMFADQVATATTGVDNPLVFDVACGEGYATQLLESRLPHVTVLSLDYDVNALSNDRWLPDNEDAPRFAAEIERIPFAAGSVDAVVSISGLTTGLELDNGMRKVSAELARVLKPGGFLIATHDTPRGINSIMDSPLDDIHGDRTEMPVVTFSPRGEMDEIVVVNTDAMQQKLDEVCARRGLGLFEAHEYQSLVYDRTGEPVFGPIFAEAATLALKDGAGYRPLEWNSYDGSWNRHYFASVQEGFEREFMLGIVEDVRTEEVEAIDILKDADFDSIFADRFMRDTLGNKYYIGLSKDQPEYSEREIRARFLVGKKK